jgi:hypothetical protein
MVNFDELIEILSIYLRTIFCLNKNLQQNENSDSYEVHKNGQNMVCKY